MTAAAWHPDPTGRHELRYWDGTQWSEHVSDGGVQSVSPLTPPEEPTAESSGSHATAPTTAPIGRGGDRHGPPRRGDGPVPHRGRVHDGDPRGRVAAGHRAADRDAQHAVAEAPMAEAPAAEAPWPRRSRGRGPDGRGTDGRGAEPQAPAAEAPVAADARTPRSRTPPPRAAAPAAPARLLRDARHLRRPHRRPVLREGDRRRAVAAERQAAAGADRRAVHGPPGRDGRLPGPGHASPTRAAAPASS